MADEEFEGLPPHLANIVPKRDGRRRGSSNYAGGEAIAQYRATNLKDVPMTSSSSSTAIPKQPVGELLEGFPQGDRKPSTYVQQQQPAPTSTSMPAPAPVSMPPPSSSHNNSGGAAPGPAVKRGSVALQPISGVGGLVDFDDSDFEDSDEDVPLPGSAVPANMPSGAHLPGGQNHRPLVGGFAAAAYEAARAHHYANVKKPAQLPKRDGPPPSI